MDQRFVGRVPVVNIQMSPSAQRRVQTVSLVNTPTRRRQLVKRALGDFISNPQEGAFAWNAYPENMETRPR